MKFTNYINPILKVCFRTWKTFFVMIYMALGIVRWQPWMEVSEGICWNYYLSWQSWCVTLLPVFLVIINGYIKYFLNPSIIIKLKCKDRKKIIFSGVICISLVLTTIYILLAIGSGIIFRFQEDRIGLIAYGIYFFITFLLFVLNGLIYCIGRCMGILNNIISIIILLIPAFEYACYFYGGISILQTRLYYDTTGGNLWSNGIFIFVILAMLFMVLGRKINKIELLGEI
ncbi:MAG: hypothetical protein PHD70_02990 [Anaerostipes sp.]|jgi:hypothetical protein|nr:hypothetical protein [Anaerostipes sp.]